MTEVTPAQTFFDDAYHTGSPPWVIDGPQPAIVELERAGWIRGRVLDVGCGTGENTVLLARLGYDVLGVDFAPNAIARARANAAAAGVDARFEVADATALDAEPGYDAIVDSALFHVFFDDADRTRYVASLHRACRPGGLVHVLALADSGRGFGPMVGEAVIRGAFADGWAVEALDSATYRGIVGAAHTELLGVPVGTTLDEPAWLLRARRV